MHLGWGEALVVLAIVVLVFGARRLPEIGKAVGEALREFKRAMKGKG